MAVTANQLIRAQEGCLRGNPVAASTHLYQGTLAYYDASTGLVTDSCGSGANPFAGMVKFEADNSSGAAGAINVELLTDGDYEMVGSGFTQASVGDDVYGSDNFTVTTSNSSTSYVGQIVGYTSATKVTVGIKKSGPSSTLSGSATGTTAATFTVDTDVGKPRTALMSQTGGTGDYTAFINAPATLTADRIFTLPADSAQTLVGLTATQTMTNKTLTSPTLTTPVIGVATGTSLAVTGLLTSSSPTAGIGYATGAGGTVTQTGSRTTTVILNTLSGNIVLVSAAGSATPFSFTLTNSAIAAGDTVIINQKSGTDKYTTQVVTAVAAGSCQITLANASGTTTEQPVFNFNVVKGVAA